MILLPQFAAGLTDRPIVMYSEQLPPCQFRGWGKHVQALNHPRLGFSNVLTSQVLSEFEHESTGVKGFETLNTTYLFTPEPYMKQIFSQVPRPY